MFLFEYLIDISKLSLLKLNPWQLFFYYYQQESSPRDPVTPAKIHNFVLDFSLLYSTSCPSENSIGSLFKKYSKLNTISTATLLLLTGLPASAFASYPFSSSWRILSMLATLTQVRHSPDHVTLLQNHSGLLVKGKSLLWFMQAYIICPSLTPLTLSPRNHTFVPSAPVTGTPSSDIPGMLPPEGLCTWTSLLLESSSSKYPQGSLFSFLKYWLKSHLLREVYPETQHHSLLLLPFPFSFFFCHYLLKRIYSFKENLLLLFLLMSVKVSWWKILTKNSY